MRGHTGVQLQSMNMEFMEPMMNGEIVLTVMYAKVKICIYHINSTNYPSLRVIFQEYDIDLMKVDTLQFFIYGSIIKPSRKF